jgi:hypothetical protein
MNIDASLYPDRQPPAQLESPQEKADYLQRVCGAFDHGLPPTAETLKELRHWKDVFDRFALPGSPAFHALRSLYGWEATRRLPYYGKPHYQLLDEIEDRTDGCERMV